MCWHKVYNVQHAAYGAEHAAYDAELAAWAPCECYACVDAVSICKVGEVQVTAGAAVVQIAPDDSPTYLARHYHNSTSSANASALVVQKPSVVRLAIHSCYNSQV